ncbi:MAG: hydrogenase formation protein HypD [Desulfobacteraceae bacterium]|nr:hydrogenase formation protein HypD [Desulfobacteraceae bacterium]
MAIKHLEEYRDAGISNRLMDNIRAAGKTGVRLMEVCGTHTVAIFRSGIRSLLPENISLLSGPGCPVCVTAQGEIDAFIETAKKEDVIITTFGDLLRVPGTSSSLQQARADGADIRIVYSAIDALELARQTTDKTIVFLGVGFETTAPTIAATIAMARQTGVGNFVVFSAHKLVPPALEALASAETVRVDGFLLPGHVSVIIGVNAYRSFFEKYQIPSVVAGFEPVDILQGVETLVAAIAGGSPALGNVYTRAVTDAGNIKAQKRLSEVFAPTDARWRGLGIIPGSGLQIAEAYQMFDAQVRYDIKIADAPEPKGCACGEILTGTKTPPECSLYKKVCTPMAPVGPCMVSSEGTCAAYYRYHV